MNVKTAIRTLLLSGAELHARVGARVYPRLAPQGQTSEYIVLTIISRPHDHTLTGSSGYATARIQINCYSRTSIAADELGELVRKRLQGYSGTSAGVVIHHCLLMDDRDGVEPAAGANERRLYFTSLDFEVAHKEARPVFV